MGATSLTREAKRQQKDMNIIGSSVPSLSYLDDQVLLHILCFLPFKEAIRTSILSKRWKYLWTALPVLDFIQTTQNTEGFMNSIRRALSLRGSSKITKFKLEGCTDAFLPVEAFISAAARCNVEYCELDLELLEEPFFLPYSFHNLATLTHLHIHLDHQRLIVYPTICLPNLRTLKLSQVTFFQETLTQNLFSGCHVLENLHIKDCFWEDVRRLSISSPKLQKVIIDDPFYLHLHNDTMADEFVIHGDDLRHFSYTGRFHFDFCILNSSSLEEVTLKDDYRNDERPSHVSKDRFDKFMGSIKSRNVRKWTLGWGTPISIITRIAPSN